MASHRGPYSFQTTDDGRLVARASGGGLASGLGPVLAESSGSWVAMAVTSEDRRAARGESCEVPSDASAEVSLNLVDVDEKLHSTFYTIACTETLWFLFHDLSPATMSSASWEAYKTVNSAMADAVHKTHGDTILLEDFHFLLVAKFLRDIGDTRPIAYFHHTPWPPLERWCQFAFADEVAAALDACSSIGFHASAWANNFLDAAPRLADRVVVTPIPPDVSSLAKTAAAADEWKNKLRAEASGRKILLRVDRIDPTKNLIRGFKAFGALLEREPALTDSVWFAAMGYPSRGNVGRYANYQSDCRAAVQSVHDKFGDEVLTWFESDDPKRSAAGMAIADAILVNPVCDGLNLVALECPSISEKGCAVALSTTAGAYQWIKDDVFGLDPLDIDSTASAVYASLQSRDTAARTAQIKKFATSRTASDWVKERLAVANR